MRNWDVFRCPSAKFEWQWKASCYPATMGRPNRRVNYGFNETFFNEPTKLPRMQEPANLVAIADNWNTFLTPWAHSVQVGVNPASLSPTLTEGAPVEWSADRQVAQRPV